jgi:hypothetical protein
VISPGMGHHGVDEFRLNSQHTASLGRLNFAPPGV